MLKDYLVVQKIKLVLRKNKFYVKMKTKENINEENCNNR